MTSLPRSLKMRAQRGAVLVVALMFLVVLTLLALTSMSGTTLEERMAGQYRDLNIAFQAAEAGLRDAERDLFGVTAVGAPPGTARANVISGRTGFGDGSDAAADPSRCTNDTDVNYGRGLCYPRDPGVHPRFPTVNFENTTAGTLQYVSYGTYSGATQLPAVTAQPRYLIEALWSGIPAGPTQSIGAGAGPPTYYRITSRGYGANPNTRITLQEMYLKPQL
jgi:type IV pilus assembly protein PilX